MAAGDIIRWISNSDTDWGTGANWTGGSVPAASEIALFDGMGQASVAGSDESAVAALRAIIVETGYTGSIGSSGSPLEHNIESIGNVEARIVFRGAGDFYFKTGAANTVPYAAVIDAPGSTVSLDGSQANGGYMLNLFVKAGNVTVPGTCGILTSCVVYGPDANVTINSSDSTEADPFVIHVMDGTLTSARITTNLAAYVVEGGKLIQQYPFADDDDVIVNAGGWLDYRPNATLGSSNNFNLFLNGVLDLRNTYQAVEFERFVRGPLAQVLGGGATQTTTAPLSIDIDLREAYP